MASASANIVSLALGRFGLLEDRDSASLAQLSVRSASYSHGETIAARGVPQSECAVIVSGMALTLTTADPKGPITGLHVPADAPDLAGVTMRDPDQSIVAQGACLVQHVPIEPLRRMADASPRLAAALWRRTAIDAQIHRAWLAAAALRATPRIAHLLCEIHFRLDRVGLVRDGAFQLPIAQKDFVRILGISRAHGNRAVQELRADGLIDWNATSVVIRDFDKLSEFGKFNENYLLVRPTDEMSLQHGRADRQPMPRPPGEPPEPRAQ